MRLPDNLPQAYSAQVFRCEFDCGCPHLVLFDEAGKPIIEVVLPDDTVRALVEFREVHHAGRA